MKIKLVLIATVLIQVAIITEQRVMIHRLMVTSNEFKQVTIDSQEQAMIAQTECMKAQDLCQRLLNEAKVWR